MRSTLTGLFGVTLLTVTVGWTSIHPSNQREWSEDQRLMPRAEFIDHYVTIENLRDFRWGPGAEVRSGWTERMYDLNEINSVWYILTPFSRDRRGPAHAFVSFGFDDGRFVAISVEARREAGELYSITGGLLKRYEVMYVVGEERDLIQQRVMRDDDVFVYPMKATREQVRELFTGMLTRVNELYEHPEFYGTLSNNCTTNLLDHVNTIASRPIRYGRRILLPGYSDEVAHERGLIDTDLPLDSARQRFLINDRALRYDDGNYSLAIRGLIAD